MLRFEWPEIKMSFSGEIQTGFPGINKILYSEICHGNLIWFII